MTVGAGGLRLRAVVRCVTDLGDQSWISAWPPGVVVAGGDRCVDRAVDAGVADTVPATRQQDAPACAAGSPAAQPERGSVGERPSPPEHPARPLPRSPTDVSSRIGSPAVCAAVPGSGPEVPELVAAPGHPATVSIRWWILRRFRGGRPRPISWCARASHRRIRRWWRPIRLSTPRAHRRARSGAGRTCTTPTSPLGGSSVRPRVSRSNGVSFSSRPRTPAVWRPR